MAVQQIDLGSVLGPQGPQGPQGPNGSTVLYGPSTPDGQTGSDGDVYIGTDGYANGSVWKKISGVWTKIITLATEGAVVDQEIVPGSTNAVAGGAVSVALDDKADGDAFDRLVTEINTRLAYFRTLDSGLAWHSCSFSPASGITITQAFQIKPISAFTFCFIGTFKPTSSLAQLQDVNLGTITFPEGYVPYGLQTLFVTDRGCVMLFMDDIENRKGKLLYRSFVQIAANTNNEIRAIVMFDTGRSTNRPRYTYADIVV